MACVTLDVLPKLCGPSGKTVGFCVWAAGFQDRKLLAFFSYTRAKQEFRVMPRSARIWKKSIGKTLIERSLPEKLAEDVG
jgi:hypothetical protein